MSDTEKASASAQPDEQEANSNPATAIQAAEGAESTTEGEEPANRRARRAAAARSRKQRVREREEAEAIGLDAQEILDDALVRSTDTAGKWLKKNASVLQWVFVAGIAGWSAWGLYGWRLAHNQAAASDELAEATRAQYGKIADESPEPDDNGLVDPTPIFPDDAARLKTAQAAFETAAKTNPSSGTSLYARLGLAGILIDQGQFDDAKAQYDQVAQSKLAKSDPELRARAVEGTAIALESKGDKEGALAQYTSLAAENVKVHAQVATYNQARLLYELNRTDEAKKVVEALYAELPPAEGIAAMFPDYLRQSIKTLASALGVEPPKPATPKITEAQLQELTGGVQKQLSLPALPQPAAPTEGTP